MATGRSAAVNDCARRPSQLVSACAGLIVLFRAHAATRPDGRDGATATARRDSRWRRTGGLPAPHATQPPQQIA
jgi:hypothetical protein